MLISSPTVMPVKRATGMIIPTTIVSPEMTAKSNQSRTQTATMRPIGAATTMTAKSETWRADRLTC